MLQQVLIVHYNLNTKTKKFYSWSKMFYLFNVKVYTWWEVFLIQTTFHSLGTRHYLSGGGAGAM